jgi:hypothetical protein
MLYAKVENGSISQYPYEIHNLRKDNSSTSFPETAMNISSIQSDYGIFEVSEFSAPVSETHNISEGSPELVNGNWSQSWEQSPKTSIELEALVIDKRRVAYGRPEEQIEYITENGLDAWQSKVDEIKTKYPKA